MGELIDYGAIDDAIATKVMGWYEETFEAYGNMVTAYYGNGQKQREKWAWQPTRQIGDAWKVLEKFPWPQYRVLLMTTESGNWRCDIHLRGGDGPVASAFDKDAPRAICLAALAAVGQPIAK